ncbi:MAG: LysE family transporter, partial [Bacteroidota bacterium]
MEANFLLYFSLGMFASFMGTIPVGPVNISVVATTLQRNIRSGIIFSGSAAFVEIFQSFIALQFGVMLSSLLFENSTFKIIVTFIFFIIGLIFLLKKQKQHTEKVSKKKLPPWLSGILISVLNPQALPFWIFVLGYYQSANLIDINLMNGEQLLCITSFLVGVSLGKFS